MKVKIIKILKLILPIFIGIYLTWYFLTNAISAEKRSFYVASSLSEDEAVELYNLSFKFGDQLVQKNGTLNNPFQISKAIDI